MKEASLDGGTLARQIVEALADRQAEAVVLIDIAKVSDFTDYFVIASATSTRQFEALAQSIEKLPEVPLPRREGTATSGWQLFDFGDVVVHLFGRAERAYYSLEDRWAAGKQLLRME